MFCSNDCSCGGSCAEKEGKPQRIATDKLSLKNLNNVVYQNIDKDKVSKFEIIHFELFFVCSDCGYTQKFEKDEASYYAIKFMANYPCISCGHTGGFSDFMVRVSPDKGIDLEKAVFINESQFAAALQSIEALKSHPCDYIGRA